MPRIELSATQSNVKDACHLVSSLLHSELWTGNREGWTPQHELSATQSIVKDAKGIACCVQQAG